MSVDLVDFIGGAAVRSAVKICRLCVLPVLRPALEVLSRVRA